MNMHVPIERRGKEYKLMAREFCIQSGVDPRVVNSTRLDVFEDLSKRLMMRLTSRLAAKEVSSKIKIPRTWFDLWIHQRCPRCLKRYFKINWLELDLRETAIFPGVNIPLGHDCFRIAEYNQTPYEL